MSRKLAAWHKEDIKAELRKRFGSLRSLALSWGYSDYVISGVLSRKRSSIPVELRVAAALGVAPQELWPDRWEPDGTPKRRPLENRSGRNRAATSQKQKAA